LFKIVTILLQKNKNKFLTHSTVKKYFAYGSNLSTKQMRSRCKKPVIIGAATLQDYKLCFDGYAPRWGGGAANILAEKGASAEGIVYQLDSEDERRLDGFEIPPYRKITVRLEKYGDVFTYIKKMCYAIAPSTLYLSKLLEGYSEYHLKKEGLLDALKECCYLGRAIFLLDTNLLPASLPSDLPSVPSYFQTKKQKGKIYFIDFRKDYLLPLLNQLLYNSKGMRKKQIGFFPIDSGFVPAWYFENL
jgi:hypothetical protein